MKILMFFFSLHTMPVVASECKLIGVLESTQKIETSFVTNNRDACRPMAQNTELNNF